MISTSAKKLELIKLRGEGFSYKDAAEKIGVSKPTVMKWVRDLSIEIANQKKLEYDSFLIKLEITREARTKRLKQITDKLETELEKRDFSDIPTSKIIEQLIKLYDQWSVECNEIEFKSKPFNLDLDQTLFNEDEIE